MEYGPVPCWACQGRDPAACEECGGRGEIGIRRCPRQAASQEALAACSLAELLEAGVLPVAGGYLDQAALWCDAAELALSLRARWRAEAQRDTSRQPGG